MSMGAASVEDFLGGLLRLQTNSKVREWAAGPIVKQPSGFLSASLEPKSCGPGEDKGPWFGALTFDGQLVLLVAPYRARRTSRAGCQHKYRAWRRAISSASLSIHRWTPRRPVGCCCNTSTAAAADAVSSPTAPEWCLCQHAAATSGNHASVTSVLGNMGALQFDQAGTALCMCTASISANSCLA
jgi:hypothetical protein